MIAKLCFSLTFLISTISCQHPLTQYLFIQVDDFLNSKLVMFPNQTIQYYQNLEDDTLEKFKSILDDELLLTSAYEKFRVRFGRRHPAEFHIHLQRKEIFKENLVFIFNHNLLARLKLHYTFEMEVNKFADMFMDEFRKEHLGLIIPEDYHADELPHFNASDITIDTEHRAVPSKFDWREQYVISPVKDQDKCGACVMFSVTASIEGHHAISRDKEIVDLSEQFIVDCAVRENGYRKNRGCDGNTFPDTLQFASDYGIPSEVLYPYQGKQGKCKLDGMYPTTHLKSYKRLPDKTNDVKHSVVQNGPVSVGIYVWKPFLFYASGVYDYCAYPSSAVGGHAMSITGYNEDGKFYIIKNQWGLEWGERGYIRYSYTDPRCGLEKLAYTFTV